MQHLIDFPLHVELRTDVFRIPTPCLVDARGRMVAQVARAKTALADLEAMAHELVRTIGLPI